jgi:hypothetical protein
MESMVPSTASAPGAQRRRPVPRPLDATLANLLARVAPGMRFNEHLDEEDEEDVPLVFAHACKMGLETTQRFFAPSAAPKSWAANRRKCPNAWPGPPPHRPQEMVKSGRGLCDQLPLHFRAEFRPCCRYLAKLPNRFPGGIFGARNPRLDATGDPRSVKLEGGNGHAPICSIGR